MYLFLDMDGVLVDLHRGLFNSHKISKDISWEQMLANWPNKEYYLHKIIGCMHEEMWAEECFNFWASLSKTEECDKIIETALQYFKSEQIYLLTKPTNHLDCFSGKLFWIRKNLPKKLHDNFVITPHKHLFKYTQGILVDDSDESVENYGGKYFLFPRPWNSGCNIRTDPLLLLQETLKRYTNNQFKGNFYENSNT